MINSFPAFEIDLYEEHVEEASFLYEQRGALLANSSISWTTLGEFEARLEAHIDALVVGAGAATTVCCERAKEGDAGELFAAVCVLCRQGNSSGLAELMRGLDHADTKRVRAIATALRSELPVAWNAFIVQVMDRQDPRLLALAASVIGHRRLPAATGLCSALEAHPTLAGPIVDALGRLAARETASTVEGQLQHPDPAVRSRALIALLRMGLEDPLRRCIHLASDDDWPLLAVGLGADRAASGVLLPLLSSQRASVSSLLALGLLGDSESLRALHECLAVPHFADDAARALHWITGAPLFENVPVGEPPDDDVDDGVESWRQPRMQPKTARPKPRVETIRKLSVDPATWSLWIAQNGGRFDPRLRYRSGQPYGPRALLGNLVDEPGDRMLRSLAAQELAIRYGCEVPFEPDMLVTAQWDAIKDIGRWIDHNAERFEPGRWYFAGRLQ